MTTDRHTITRHTHSGGASHEGPLSECREHSHRTAESRNIVVRRGVATCKVDGCTWTRDVERASSLNGFPRCESGWTGDRCTFRLGHEGDHSNPGGWAGPWPEDEQENTGAEG